MVLRLLSRQRTGEQTHGTAATLDQARRLRESMVGVFIKAHRGRLSGVARSTRLDCGKYRRFDRGDRCPRLAGVAWMKPAKSASISAARLATVYSATKTEAKHYRPLHL
jgi:hypothetical protein